MRQFRFSPALPERPAVGDAVLVLGIATVLYAGLRLALRVPAVIAGRIFLSRPSHCHDMLCFPSGE